jgi:hypothetical protein
MNNDVQQDAQEIIGLRGLLVDLANTQNQFADTLMKVHALLQDNGLVMDLGLSTKPIPLGFGGDLVNSLVAELTQPAAQRVGVMEEAISSSFQEALDTFNETHLSEAKVDEQVAEAPRPENWSEWTQLSGMASNSVNIDQPTPYMSWVIERMREQGKWEYSMPVEVSGLIAVCETFIRAYDDDMLTSMGVDVTRLKAEMKQASLTGVPATESSMPTEIDTSTPEEQLGTNLPTEAEPPQRFNVVGKFLVPTLKRYLSPHVMRGAVGNLDRFKHFREDLTMIPVEKLLGWPTGLYRSHDGGVAQLLINARVDGDSAQCVAVIPCIYSLDTPVGNIEVDIMEGTQAFIAWVNTDRQIRRFDDAVSDAVLTPILPVLGNLIHNYLNMLANA